LQLLKALWSFRMFVLSSVKREFQVKYRSSLLGAAWTLINPLAMILVYTVIFSQVMKAKLPGVESDFAFSIYLCAGVLTWGLFAEIVGRGQTVFLENANLLKKISFPRMCLPLIVVLNALVNFAIIFGLFLTFLLISGFWPGWPSLAIIPILAIELLFAIGLGMTLGVLNVFFRDVGQFFGIFLQFWFWFTPVVYPVSILPEDIKSLMVFNPMYPLIQAFQNIFINHAWPDWASLIYPLALGVLLCILGLRLFRKHAAEMVDEL
jgi:lipopolysaccharide transport system permease protein